MFTPTLARVRAEVAPSVNLQVSFAKSFQKLRVSSVSAVKNFYPISHAILKKQIRR